MKEPIVIPEGGHVPGFIYRDGKLEEHLITRYGLLEGCSLPSITAVGRDNRSYQTSPGWLHDTKLEAIREEEQNLREELDEINGQMSDLLRRMVNTARAHAVVVEQMVAEASKEQA